MFIKKVIIRNIRNIKDITVFLHPRTNVFFGDNGAGKTSIAEALYLGVAGFSFRSRNNLNILRTGCKEFSIYTEICYEDNCTLALSIQKSLESATVVKVNGEKEKSIERVLRILPARAFNPDSHNTVCGPPRLRRQYLDWGIFHLKETFYPEWKAYRRCLMQRNALIANKPSRDELAVWDKYLQNYALKIHLIRKSYFDELCKTIDSFMKQIGFGSFIRMRYFAGWNTKMDLERVFYENYEADIRASTTTRGPHRADIRIEYNCVHKAKFYISRGQQKSIALVMMIAQIFDFLKKSASSCLILLDDIQSELDEKNLSWFIKKIEGLGQQAVWTSLTTDRHFPSNGNDRAMFHMKHGDLSPFDF